MALAALLPVIRPSAKHPHKRKPRSDLLWSGRMLGYSPVAFTEAPICIETRAPMLELVVARLSTQAAALPLELLPITRLLFSPEPGFEAENPPPE